MLRRRGWVGEANHGSNEAEQLPRFFERQGLQPFQRLGGTLLRARIRQMTRPARSNADAMPAFLAIPEGDRNHEIIDGVVVERASPSGSHGSAQAGIITGIRGPFDRRSGGGDGGPGGWWIATEVEVELLAGVLVRPDVVGWRRDRVSERPSETLVHQRPDWICEVVSPSTASRDRIVKLARYHEAGVPHYWIADPNDRTLLIFRWSESGYVAILGAQGGDTIRAEPFAEVELRVSWLFGED
jgi:Uma2 family endonuclease